MSPVWRGPYGESSDETRKIAAEAGFPVQLGADIPLRDYNDEDTGDYSAKEMTDTVLKSIDGWLKDVRVVVIYGHLMNTYQWQGGGSKTNELARMKSEMEKRGYEFVFARDVLSDAVKQRSTSPHKIDYKRKTARSKAGG